MQTHTNPKSRHINLEGLTKCRLHQTLLVYNLQANFQKMLHLKQVVTLQLIPFKSLKSYLQSTKLSVHLSTIYKQSLGRIYTLHLIITPHI